MRKEIIWLLLILLPSISLAQFDNLLKRTKDKITKPVDDQIDKAIDKKLEEAEGKQPATTSTQTDTNLSNQSAKEVATPTTPETVKSFSKFDFVPGERIGFPGKSFAYLYDFKQS